MLVAEQQDGGQGASTLESRLNEHQQVLERLARDVEALRGAAPEDRLSLVVFSGELDRQLAAFVIATGAAASGMTVSMFFTFWGTTALRRQVRVSKDIWGRMFGWMLPTGSRKLQLSQLNLGGAGPLVMRHLMRSKGVASLEEMIEIASELEVKLNVCTMTMDLLGLQPDEMIAYPHLEYCGVASFVDLAARSRATLFI